MKSLKPSMRENKRYLWIEGSDLKTKVPRIIKEFIGILGITKASPKFIETNGNKGILSINRQSLDYVKASFAFYPGEISIKKVSGTLKRLRKN